MIVIYIEQLDALCLGLEVFLKSFVITIEDIRTA